MEASYHRHEISDKVWALLEPHLPGQRGQWGGIAQDNRRFTSKQELVRMLESYIHYYNTRRVQRHLGVLTPMEKHELCLAA